MEWYYMCGDLESLTDLQTRRADLSASAELLVTSVVFSDFAALARFLLRPSR